MLDSVILGSVSLFALVGLIVLRIPIAYAMIAVGMGGIIWVDGTGGVFNQLKTLAYGQFSIYDLSVVPLFILMGVLSTKVGISRAVFEAAAAWVGWMRGGMAMSAILSCAGFGAVCGSSLATVSSMGKIALPELKRYGYSPQLAAGTLAAGGVLGILIPPSVVLVIYAVLVEASIVDMFVAAFIPGMLAVVLFMATIAIFVRINPDAGPRGAVPNRQQLIVATLGILPALGIFILVIGGMYLGIFNPTPAASMGVFLVGIYGIITGRLNWQGCIHALKQTVATSGMIYLILLGAEILSIYMSRIALPQHLAALAVQSHLSPMAIMVVVLIALIVLGCLMDSLSMILLVIPFFWPVLVEINGGIYQGADGAGFGMNTEDLKIWFGILALIVVELGLITPPVGLNVFIISLIDKTIPLQDIFKGVLPFFLSELGRVVILLAFPAISLWLPTVLRG